MEGGEEREVGRGGRGRREVGRDNNFNQHSKKILLCVGVIAWQLSAHFCTLYLWILSSDCLSTHNTRGLGASHEPKEPTNSNFVENFFLGGGGM